jgi:N-acetylglucosaminyl-diphospho-decaprenol L-rhamnosyltransferase
MYLAIVIINYRTPHLVINCLESLEPQIDINEHCVILVDNDSGDDSVSILEEAIVKKQWNGWVNLIASPINGGFSAGNNVGINAISAECYLLLNSDTIVRPGAISSLLKALEQNPEAGLISPRLEWPDGTSQISCFRYHSLVSELINSAATGPITSLFLNYNVPIPVSDSPFEPQWVSFACVLIRREIIEQIGLMDEGYFMYFDDVDYCRRAKEAGCQVLYWPDAHVVHLRGGSGSVKSDIAERKRPPVYLYASRSRYFARFYGIVGLWVANLFWLMGRTVSFMRELIWQRPTHICKYAEQDIWINWRNPLKLPVLPETTKVNHEQTP